MIIVRKILLIMLFPVLVACSPHRGAGTWTLENGRDATFDRIVVMFDGRAEFYAQERDQHLLRCFWSGTDRDTVRMDCVSAVDAAMESTYILRVTRDDAAELRNGDVIIGSYRRQQAP